MDIPTPKELFGAENAEDDPNTNWIVHRQFINGVMQETRMPIAEWNEYERKHNL